MLVPLPPWQNENMPANSRVDLGAKPYKDRKILQPSPSPTSVLAKRHSSQPILFLILLTNKTFSRNAPPAIFEPDNTIK
jgi:hypothetical protein